MARMKQKFGKFFRRNWFKLGFALLLVYIVTKKNLSFQINWQAPANREQPEQVSPPSAHPEPNDPVLTDQGATKPSGANRFNFSPFGKRKSKQQQARPRSLPDKPAIEKLDLLSESEIIDYIERFAKVAIMEREKFGIPSSLIIANGLLHSQAGTSSMVKQGENHFQLPCSDNWDKATITYGGACYRAYPSAWTSFRDHSIFLTTGPYQSLAGRLGSRSYASWAKQLEKIGFSEEKNYAEQVIRIIESYGLQKLDYQ